jgi:Tfp pilus assembly protein FimT
MHHVRSSSRARGFTLTEMLVILGVIVLILAIALPAFNAVSGSRSVEAGTNIAQSAVSRARAEAIRRGVPCGALFFVDAQGRTAVAFVALTGGSGGGIDAGSDPDPYDEYKAFLSGLDYQGSSSNPPDLAANGAPPMTRDRVTALFSDRASGTYTGDLADWADRPLAVRLERTNETLAGGNPLLEPGAVGDLPVGFPGGAGPVDYQGDSDREFGFGTPVNAFVSSSGGVAEVSLLEDIPVERLPNGVGLQIVTGAALDSDNGSDGAVDPGGVFRERYTRAGIIAFDANGRMIFREFDVGLGTPLARVMGLETRVASQPTSSVALGFGGWRPAGGASLATGFGIVLYREDDFNSAARDGTALQWQGSFFTSTDSAPIDVFDTTPGDLNFTYPAWDTADAAEVALRTVLNEYAEERWLDANTEPLLVNRFSGTLVSNQADQDG